MNEHTEAESFFKRKKTMRYLASISALFLFIACNGDKPASGQQKQPPADTLETSSRTSAEGEGKDSMDNLIRVEQPLPNQEVASPLTVKGQARGYWFFEASFPVALLTQNGQSLASGIAEARGEWMTEDFVPFQLTLEFDAPAEEKGYLRFEKANPSGLPENDMAYRLPVIFK